MGLNSSLVSRSFCVYIGALPLKMIEVFQHRRPPSEILSLSVSATELQTLIQQKPKNIELVPDVNSKQAGVDRLSLASNMILLAKRRFTWWVFPRYKQIKFETEYYAKILRMECQDLSTRLDRVSLLDRWKVLIARALLNRAEGLMIVHSQDWHPASADLIHELAHQGLSILLVRVGEG
jgi:ABC-type sugar transport system ATPase subunit